MMPVATRHPPTITTKHSSPHTVTNRNGCQGSRRRGPLMIIVLGIIVVFMANQVSNVLSIDCFKCVSYNGGNKACDDPFHNNQSTTILESPCMGGRKGRDGLFPATACIKIAGYYDDTGESITVRGCALDSGTLTTDTEIVRMSHCGKFYYDDRYVHGCLQSCSDADACNGANSHINIVHRRTTSSLASSLLVYITRIWLTVFVLWPWPFAGFRWSLIVTAANLRRLFTISKDICNYYKHHHYYYHHRDHHYDHRHEQNADDDELQSQWSEGVECISR